jgi:hypothetical protein
LSVHENDTLIINLDGIKNERRWCVGLNEEIEHDKVEITCNGRDRYIHVDNVHEKDWELLVIFLPRDDDRQYLYMQTNATTINIVDFHHATSMNSELSHVKIFNVIYGEQSNLCDWTWITSLLSRHQATLQQVNVVGNLQKFPNITGNIDPRICINGINLLNQYN